jgi:hypothetical protein
LPPDVKAARELPKVTSGVTVTDADTGQTAAAASFASSVTQLAAVGPTFATVFATGATQIGASGQTAADAIAAGASGAGATYGNAAGAAIRAAVAGITIPVGPIPNGGAKPVDTGSQSTAG